MKITKTEIEGLLIIEPRIFNDDRGYFYESYNKTKFVEAGIDVDFVQDNQSFSHKGAVVVSMARLILLHKVNWYV